MNTKKKILIIGPLPPPYAGVEIVTSYLLNSRILKEKFLLFHLNTKKPIRNDEKGKLKFKNIFYNIKDIIRAFTKIVVIQPAIVHLPLSQKIVPFLRDSFYVLIAKLFNKKVVIHTHGSEYERFLFNNPRYNKFVFSVLKKADKIILLSNQNLNIFNKYFAKERLTVVYNGIDISRFGKVIDKKDFLKIFFIGHISEGKGAVDIFRIMPNVLKRINTKVKFIFAGKFVRIEGNITFIKDPNHSEEKINSIIKKHNLNDYVEFLGFISGEEKIYHFKSSDIFVFPSYSEGCSMAILEAIASGLPIITTPVGSNKDLLINGVNALLIEPGDLKALENVLVKLINDHNLRTKLSENNIILAKEKISIEHFENNILHVWMEVIQK